MVSDQDVVIRLVAIVLLSGLIGLEREYHRRPAGLRTNVMIGIGATLVTMASIQTVDLWPDIRPIDPGRIAAQIVSGIGFIGAGVILRETSRKVVGLTTAATLWVVAGLGIAVGMGLFLEAFVATALVFITFFLFTPVVIKMRTTRDRKNSPFSISSNPEEGEE
ncbi:MgtC/SapB family protein [Patescibacteria group bacterium]|nr:MgtC/SapB family protein [Patescibacteria group bacterium]MBU1916032.1 MgtC/SapB family protein [Patescibacteria group bacterium]